MNVKCIYAKAYKKKNKQKTAHRHKHIQNEQTLKFKPNHRINWIRRENLRHGSQTQDKIKKKL